MKNHDDDDDDDDDNDDDDNYYSYKHWTNDTPLIFWITLYIIY